MVLILSIVAVVLIGIAIFLFTRKKGPKPPQKPAEPVGPPPSQPSQMPPPM